MKIAILLCLLPVCFAGPSVPGERGVFSEEGCGESKCQQGEGDCDSDDDCVEGLVCDFDGWWGTDYCVAGPKTKDGKVSEWGEWETCSAVECGTRGTQTRMRSCIVPMFGGKPCPADVEYTDQRECSAPACATTAAAPPTTPAAPTIQSQTSSNPACNPNTWDKFDWECCSEESPCFANEGDCDSDDECAGELVCARQSCPPDTFKARAFGRKPDCCQQPGEESATPQKPESKPAPTEAPTTAVPTTTTAAQPEAEEEPKTKAACNPATWEKFTFQCCTPDSPCYAGEGDCDRDEDCAGELVCRRKNCGDGFRKRYSGNRPACCGLA